MSGKAEPTSILMASAVRSPIKRLYLRFRYWITASSISYRANALSMSAPESIVSRVGMVSARAEETSAPSAKSEAASARGRRGAPETRAEGVERMLEGKGLG